MRPYGASSEPARIFEGTDEVDLEKKEARPAGSSEEGSYFWKMTQDKRFIEAGSFLRALLSSLKALLRRCFMA